MKDTAEGYCILILAAGSSSRMGKSKQLLPIGNTTLLRQVIQEAQLAKPSHIVVVLGANEQHHKSEIGSQSIEIVKNNDWERGIGSSIKVGVKYILEKHTQLKGLIISVCDQPYLRHKQFIKLIEVHSKTKKQIAASAYCNALGVPVLFDLSIAPALSELNDNQGAKEILKRHSEQIASVDFPKGEIDLDTIEDYNRFIQQ